MSTKNTEVGQDEVIHSVDGIEEYDNKLPNWWLFTLYGAIAFSAVYWIAYHSFDFLPNPDKALKIEQEEQARLHGGGGGGEAVTNETLIAASKDSATAAKGKEIFMQNCVACHAATGASTPGGVGPNLTDEYWIHGGAPTDILNTITKGVPDKGMLTWGPTLGPEKTKAVAAYVLTLRDTNVKGGKEPQGDPYKP
ncbi:MAG: c-type cytochrome [Polyangiaceae bacterium]|nr:c-type cytochrome [Polyangiaceae bacterium]